MISVCKSANNGAISTRREVHIYHPTHYIHQGQELNPTLGSMRGGTAIVISRVFFWVAVIGFSVPRFKGKKVGHFKASKQALTQNQECLLPLNMLSKQANLTVFPMIAFRVRGVGEKSPNLKELACKLAITKTATMSA